MFLERYMKASRLQQSIQYVCEPQQSRRFILDGICRGTRRWIAHTAKFLHWGLLPEVAVTIASQDIARLWNRKKCPYSKFIDQDTHQLTAMKSSQWYLCFEKDLLRTQCQPKESLAPPDSCSSLTGVSEDLLGWANEKWKNNAFRDEAFWKKMRHKKNSTLRLSAVENALIRRVKEHFRSRVFCALIKKRQPGVSQCLTWRWFKTVSNFTRVVAKLACMPRCRICSRTRWAQWCHWD